jgi:hypothetical protein
MSQGFIAGIPIDTDVTLAANSDLLVPSQKAVKTFVDTAVGGISTNTDGVYTEGDGSVLTPVNLTKKAQASVNLFNYQNLY